MMTRRLRYLGRGLVASTPLDGRGLPTGLGTLFQEPLAPGGYTGPEIVIADFGNGLGAIVGRRQGKESSSLLVGVPGSEPSDVASEGQDENHYQWGWYWTRHGTLIPAGNNGEPTGPSLTFGSESDNGRWAPAREGQQGVFQIDHYDDEGDVVVSVTVAPVYDAPADATTGYKCVYDFKGDIACYPTDTNGNQTGPPVVFDPNDPVPADPGENEDSPGVNTEEGELAGPEARPGTGTDHTTADPGAKTDSQPNPNAGPASEPDTKPDDTPDNEDDKPQEEETTAPAAGGAGFGGDNDEDPGPRLGMFPHTGGAPAGPNEDLESGPTLTVTLGTDAARGGTDDTLEGVNPLAGADVAGLSIGGLEPELSHDPRAMGATLVRS